MCPAVPTITLFVGIDMNESVLSPRPVNISGSNFRSYFAAAISSTMACAAARGSGRSKNRPANHEEIGASADRFGRRSFPAWSSDVDFTVNLLGERRASRSGKSRPQALRIALASSTEATTPSTPAFFAKLRQFHYTVWERRRSQLPSWFSDPCSSRWSPPRGAADRLPSARLH